MKPEIPALLDAFVPTYDVRGRHRILVHAPATLVMDVAQNFPIESIWLVRTLFRVRAWLLGEAATPPASTAGLVDQLTAGGWQKLAEAPGRYFIAGAACSVLMTIVALLIYFMAPAPLPVVAAPSDVPQWATIRVIRVPAIAEEPQR